MLSLVAVCLCVIVPDAAAQECLEEVGSLLGADFPAIAVSGTTSISGTGYTF